MFCSVKMRQCVATCCSRTLTPASHQARKYNDASLAQPRPCRLAESGAQHLHLQRGPLPQRVRRPDHGQRRHQPDGVRVPNPLRERRAGAAPGLRLPADLLHGRVPGRERAAESVPPAGLGVPGAEQACPPRPRPLPAGCAPPPRDRISAQISPDLRPELTRRLAGGALAART